MTYSELEDQLNGALDDIKEARKEFGDLSQIIGRFGFKQLGAFPALDRKLEDRLRQMVCEFSNIGG